MASPITWRGTSAQQPDFRAAADLIRQGGNQIKGSLSVFDTIIADKQARKEQGKKDNTAAFEEDLRQRYNTPEALQEARASGEINELRDSYASLNSAGSDMGFVDNLITQGQNQENTQDAYDQTVRQREARPLREAFANAKAKGDVSAMEEILASKENYLNKASDEQGLFDFQAAAIQKEQDDLDRADTLKQRRRTVAIQEDQDAQTALTKEQAPMVDKIREHIVNKDYDFARAMLDNLELDKESSLWKELSASISGDEQTKVLNEIQRRKDEVYDLGQQTVNRFNASEDAVKDALSQGIEANETTVRNKYETASAFMERPLTTEGMEGNFTPESLYDQAFLNKLNEADYGAYIEYVQTMSKFDSTGDDIRITADLNKKIASISGITTEEGTAAENRYRDAVENNNRVPPLTQIAIEEAKRKINKNYKSNDLIEEIKTGDSREKIAERVVRQNKAVYDELKGFNKIEFESVIDTIIGRGLEYFDTKANKVYLKLTETQANLVLSRLTEENLLERNAMDVALEMLDAGLFDENKEAVAWEMEMEAVDEQYGSIKNKGNNISAPSDSFDIRRSVELREAYKIQAAEDARIKAVKDKKAADKALTQEDSKTLFNENLKGINKAAQEREKLRNSLISRRRESR